MSDTSQKVLTFTSANIHLEGVFHLPDKDNPPVVIGSHGLLSTKESPKQIALAEKCTEMGVAYFRIDHTGCGSSKGTFTETTLDTRINDVLSAAHFLTENRLTSNKIMLFGSSMGGATAIGAYGLMKKKSLILKG